MTHRTGPSALAITLAFAAVYVIWGSTYLAILIAIETLPPFLMAGTRFMAAGAPLVRRAGLGGRGCELRLPRAFLHSCEV